MKVLVTGASGFVGKHLVKELLAHGHTPILTTPEPYDFIDNRGHKLRSVVANICNPKSMQDLIRDAQPDGVVHLAGLAHVVEASRNPSLLVDVTVDGTKNICAAIDQNARSNIAFLYISSAFVYGTPKTPGSAYVNESSPVNPQSIYGLCKLAAEYVVRAFASERMTPYIVRPFNHIGPGQNSSFVCPGFARRVSDAKSGDFIPVGNLNSQRDFSDVRDIVCGYRLILEKRPSPHTFVLGSGHATKIQTIFDKFVTLSGKNLRPAVQADLLRNKDDMFFLADTQLMKTSTGWTPNISIDQSLQDIYEEAASLS